jgi:hypothetical protein
VGAVKGKVAGVTPGVRGSVESGDCRGVAGSRGVEGGEGGGSACEGGEGGELPLVDAVTLVMPSGSVPASEGVRRCLASPVAKAVCDSRREEATLPRQPPIRQPLRGTKAVCRHPCERCEGDVDGNVKRVCRYVCVCAVAVCVRKKRAGVCVLVC